MIIYNKAWLSNQQIQNETELAYDAHLVSASEKEEIKQKYPSGFYTPGIFTRIGLFILTNIIASAATGLFALLLLDAHVLDSPISVFLLAVLTYIALEIMVRQSGHYKSGVDDALILSTVGAFLTGVCWAVFEVKQQSDEKQLILIAAIMFVFCLFLTLRFADMLMAACTAIALLTVVFFCGYAAGPAGQMILPFAMIICSALIYFFADRMLFRLKHWYYENCLVFVQIVALMALYCSGNYFVVKSLNEVVSYSTEHPAPEAALPFGFFFWAWTILIPLVYIGAGLKKKNVVLLRSGLLLVAAAAFTFRQYYHLMSLEVMLCLAGAVLIGIAYGVIRYLKVPKHGFTYEETDDKHLMDHMRVESLIVSETFSGASSAPAEGSKFGGGSFGGGGSGGEF